MDRLESRGTVRAIDSDKHLVTSVISTGALARDGAIIDPAGWTFAEYLRNPVVLWAHDDSRMPPAKTVDLFAKDGELIAVAEFDDEDPEAERLFRKIERGFINSTSVRWDPQATEIRSVEVDGESQDVLVFTRQELLEWSFVPIPADPGATILRAGSNDPADLSPYLPEVKPDPAPARNDDAARAATAVAAMIQRRQHRPRQIRELVLTGLAEATGRTPDKLQEIMQHG